MPWLELTTKLPAHHSDSASDFLEGLGALAVTTENAGEDEFYEVAFPGKPSWQTIALTALFEETANVEIIAHSLQNHLAESTLVEIPMVITKVDDQQWERVWLESFKPLQVGKELWVVPTWCDPIDPNARNIRLDPGLAFGTGTHATTFMCLEWIAQQDFSGHTVLDFGAGSGILAIATLLANADHADAVDIDPLAVSACAENFARNSRSGASLSSASNCFETSEFLSNDSQYDLVIANILAEVLIELRDLLTQRTKVNGKILLTGILAEQADKVANIYANEFDFERQQKEHWVLLIGTRRKP